jgi:hypothetical protein
VTSLAAASIPASMPAGSSSSWYMRRRDQTALGEISSAANSQPRSQPRSQPMSASETAPASVSQTPRQPIGPPSVIDSGFYSVAQPQSEQTYGQATPTASSARSTPRYR